MMTTFHILIGILYFLKTAEGLSRIPREESSRFCQLPKHPEHGNWSIFGKQIDTTTQEVPRYTVLTFQCNFGYKLSTSTSNIYLVCDDGKWIGGDIPSCLKTCPPLKSTATTKIKCRSRHQEEIPCDEVTEEGSFASSCAPYYETVGKTFGVCGDGTWDLPSPRCQPVCGRKTIRSPSLLLKREIAQNGDLPWAAVLFHKNSEGFRYACAGTILSERIILTVAHCVANEYGDPLPKENVEIGVGNYYNKYKDSRDAFAQYSKVEKIIIPESYRGDTRRYLSDIAVVVTENTLVLSKYVQPVCYMNLPEISLDDNIVGMIAGYRFPRYPDDNIAEKRSEIDVIHVPESVCLQKIPSDWKEKYYTADKMCGGYFDTENCLNSGGGLVFKNKENDRYYVHGILSVARKTSPEPCNFTNPLYTKVVYHYDWLGRIISQYNTA